MKTNDTTFTFQTKDGERHEVKSDNLGDAVMELLDRMGVKFISMTAPKPEQRVTRIADNVLGVDFKRGRA